MNSAMDAAPAGPYLRVQDIWKTFGAFTALRAVDLDVAPGELVCVLGPSGCGKTTLLRILAGLEAAERGRVLQGGRDVTRLPPAQRDFGIVFQSYALFPNLTAGQNVAYGLESRRRPRAEIRRRVTELLELVGLPESRDKYPAQLSGGQQQRIALARALALSPGLLLLDEPLSALDAAVRANLRREVRDIQRRLEVTTLMVTHDQTEALTMADRIVVMDAGRIVQVGTPHEIYWQPTTPFVAGFIGMMNWLAGVIQGDGSTVRCGDLALPLPHPVVAAPGEAVLVAVRPEAVRVARHDGPSNGHGTDPGGVSRIAAEVRSLEFYGGFYRLALAPRDVRDANVLADVSVEVVRDLQPRPGDALEVGLPHHHVHVFAPDGRTGRA